MNLEEAKAEIRACRDRIDVLETEIAVMKSRERELEQRARLSHAQQRIEEIRDQLAYLQDRRGPLHAAWTRKHRAIQQLKDYRDLSVKDREELSLLEKSKTGIQADLDSNQNVQDILSAELRSLAESLAHQRKLNPEI